MNDYTFPDGFTWGVATAAYQIEGAVEEDGRKPDIWDHFSRLPGRTVDGETGRFACDHYHRYRDDVKLMADLGVKAYRFSVAWPRVMPDGRGPVNDKGIDFYKRLLDELRKYDIEPYITLFHWDSPYALEEEYGTWRDRRIADDFANYCTETVKRLGDRCTNWFTLNEVFCFTRLGYGVGTRPQKAPGTIVDRIKDVEQTVHHAILAHGKGVQAIRAASPVPCRVGLVDNPTTFTPVTETQRDIDAAWKAWRRANGGVLVPMLSGQYDPGHLEDLGPEAPDFTDADLKDIHQPIDMLGLNLYTSHFVRAADNARGYDVIPHQPGHPYLQVDWLRFTPDTNYWGIRAIRDAAGYDPNVPIYITENGCAGNDQMNDDGEVLDSARLMYLRASFRSAHRAASEGHPLRGYFVWSLMDNFEWQDGYASRFGLVHVNFETQQRTPKLSAHYLTQCARANRAL